MAISTKPTRRMMVHEVDDREVPTPVAKPKRKWMRRFGLCVLVLAVAAWFLPMILTKTPLLSWAINRFGHLGGRVNIQTASLGWLSAPSFSGVELRDEKNQPVIENLSVSGSNSLFGMITNPSNLGSFKIDKPKLIIRLRADGSNVEDVLAYYMSGESSSSKKIGVEVEITDATVEVIDETSERNWQLDQFSLSLKMSATDTEPMTVKTSGRLPDPRKPGKLSASASLILSPKADVKSLNDLSLKTENFPLDILQPVLARCGVQSQTTGWLNADLHTTSADKTLQGKTTVEGSAAAEDFAIVMPALGIDQFRLSTFRADGKGSLNGERIDLEHSSLVCDLGNAQLTGSVLLHDAAGNSNLTAAGLLRQRCELSGRVDLARLATMFPHLLHVREKTQINSGEVQASFISRPQGNAPNATAMTWQGQFQALNLTATNNGKPVTWAKPIAAGFTAHEESRGIVIDVLQCDSSFLKITGSGTTDNLTAAASFNLKDLADQLGQFVDLSQYQFAGEGWANINYKRIAEQMTGDVKLHVDRFALASPSMNFDEPQFDLAAAGSWASNKGRLNVESASLSNSTLAAAAKDLVLSLPEKGPIEITGTLQYQGNLNRLQQCFADRTKPSSFALGGTIAGGADFKEAGGVIHCETSADVTNLTVADASGQKFQEPIIKLTAAGDYDNNSKLITIDKAEISSSTVAASGWCKTNMTEPMRIDANSQVTYDLNRISALLRPSFGRKVFLAGRGTGPMTWRGPLGLDKAQASAELKWDSAYLYGFGIGPATIKPKLEGGVLAIEPMQVAMNQGKLNLAPKVRLAPGPMELTMPAGPLAEHVQITPDMCEMLLKYIHPILVGVTEAHGTFSIELAKCRLPLVDPKQGELMGKFIVDDVEIGPGPFIRELAILMNREAPAKLRQQSVVNFQMYQGRIYHDNMELQFPDFTIYTKGSVGIDDQSLTVLAEMPIPPKWLVNNPLAPGLKDQVIGLPIAGTLTSPQLDKAKIDEYMKQFIRKGVNNMLEEGLNKGFEQLFRKPGQ